MDYTTLDFDQMRDALAAGGVMIGKFDQFAFAKATTGNGIDQGYCNGVCIDWPRRALLS